jgi:hypothetical protein
MSIQQYIDDTEMGIDFSDLETKSIEDLRELTQKYRTTYYNYKHKIYPKHNETISVFGDYPFIYQENSKSIINLKLITLYRKKLQENYLKAMELGKQKSKVRAEINKTNANKKYYELNQDKLKLQMSENYKKNKEIHKEKIICDICNGCYTYTNKSHHLKSQKHKNASEKKIDLDS